MAMNPEAERKRTAADSAHQFRITKYDPGLRDSNGLYTRDEWTSFGQVGEEVGLEDYLPVEAAYIDTAVAFLNEAGIQVLRVQGLENRQLSPIEFVDGAVLGRSDWEQAFRAVLREEVWCRFESSDAFVHFGWDYYMYIGVPTHCPAALALAEDRGLFVEAFASPYTDE